MHLVPRLGAPVYTSDGPLAGQVEHVSADGITVGGRILMNEIVESSAGGRLTISYAAAQLAWQGGAMPDARSALNDDPAGEGELANMIEEQRQDAPQG